MNVSKFVALFLFCAGMGGAACADSGQAVILERQGDRVVINKGVDDGVKVGQTWKLGPNGKFVVESIREHSASGRLVGEASVGSVASLGKEALQKLPASGSSLASNPSAQEKISSRRTSSVDSLEGLRKKYRRAISAKTESHTFETPVPGQYNSGFNTGMEAYNLYQLYDITNTVGLDPTGSFIANPLVLASAAAGMFQRNRMVSDLYDDARVKVEVEATYWDDSLVDLQTEVSAAEQGLSVSDTLTKKVQNVVEKGVDRYVVIEVRVKNTGKIAAQLEPFKYRVFMMSNEEKPIAASRVDAALDKTLQPGDEVRGMVYFPKIVAAGQSELKIAFEQMFGDRGTLTFSAR